MASQSELQALSEALMAQDLHAGLAAVQGQTQAEVEIDIR